MGKCRPLSDDETAAMIEATPNLRDRCLLIGVKTTGYRANEMHHLKVEDVFDFGSQTIKPRVQVQVKYMKKQKGRMALPIVPEWRAALVLWLAHLKEQGYLRLGVPLWLSRKKHEAHTHRARLYGLSRETIWRVVRQAAIRAGVNPDRVGVHSLRKLFCVKMYLACERDIEKTRRIMGHAQLSSTQQYLESITDNAELEEIILRAA